MAGTSALSLVRVPGGTVLRLGWQGGGAPRSRRQGGLLVHRHHQCIRTQRPCVEGHQFRHGGREGGIPRRFGRQPDMLPPGCQVRRGQHPAHRGGGARFNAPLRDERARQVGTLPRGETAAQEIRALAGQAYHVERDLGGKPRPWPRGQGRRRARPDAGRESAWPPDAPPSVGRPRSPPRPTGSGPRPGGG